MGFGIYGKNEKIVQNESAESAESAERWSSFIFPGRVSNKSLHGGPFLVNWSDYVGLVHEIERNHSSPGHLVHIWSIYGQELYEKYHPMPGRISFWDALFQDVSLLHRDSGSSVRGRRLRQTPWTWAMAMAIEVMAWWKDV